GLNLNGGPVTIKALVIRDFGGGTGIATNGPGITLTLYGSYIGTDVTGAIAHANFNGISCAICNLGDGTAGNPNLIPGNVNTPTPRGAQNSTVNGNYIGTNAAGTAALGNGGVGVLDGAGSNTISNNVISGNGFFAVDLPYANASTAFSTVSSNS